MRTLLLWALIFLTLGFFKAVWDSETVSVPAIIRKLSVDPNVIYDSTEIKLTPQKLVTVPKAIDTHGILFSKGEKVSCIYQGIFNWTNGDEFIKPITLNCIVIEASDELIDLEPRYQHIHVDCSASIAKHSGDKPGSGLVKNHPLNYKQLWLNSHDCYNFVTED